MSCHMYTVAFTVETFTVETQTCLTFAAVLNSTCHVVCKALRV